MYTIEGTDIALGRGESLMLAIDTKGRVIANGSMGLFTVKEKLKDDTAVLTKTATFANRSITISFVPSDTIDLKAKNYHWSLKITDSDGNVSLPVEDGGFAITEVV